MKNKWPDNLWAAFTGPDYRKACEKVLEDMVKELDIIVIDNPVEEPAGSALAGAPAT